MRALVRHVVQFDRWAEALGMGLDSAMMGISLMLQKEELLPPISLQMIRAQGAYLSHGEQVFVVGPKMRGMLENTTLTGVKSEDIHLPYPAIWVATPDCGQQLWDGSSWHKMEGFYAYRTAPAEVRFRDGKVLPPQDVISVVLWGQNPGRESGDDAMQSFHVPLGAASGRFEEYLEDTYGATYRVEYDLQEVTEKHRRTLVASSLMAFRVLINMALYLSSPGGEAEELDESRVRRRTREKLEKRAKVAKKESKRTKASKAANKVARSRVVLVGGTIEATATSLKTGTGTSPRTHWVRGHWHRYWDGKGKALSRMNWVQPFERGSGGPAPKHEYRVEEA